MKGVTILFFIDMVLLAGMLSLFWMAIYPKYRTWYWPALGCLALWCAFAAMGVYGLWR